VVSINKKRQSDLSKVEIEILKGTSTIISTNQIVVSFYQTNPVSEKVQRRQLRAGIYSQTGELISDQHDLIFDIESDNPRKREMKAQFLISKKSDEFNNQKVVLKLEESIQGTTHFREYKSVEYTMRRSFTSDFDF